MNEEEAFLHAICESPHEDTPRLVFADWLDEQGGDVNAAWAELIRVQVRLARGAGAEREQLVDRERAVQPAAVAGWVGRWKLPDDLKWENWTRGFPLTLSGSGASIRTARLTFAGRVPLREFNLDPATDADLAEFTTWPELQLVRKLGIWTTRNNPITEQGILALAGCEYLADLERLRMQQVAYTDTAMEAFIDSPHLSRLISVKIVGIGFEPLGEDVRRRVRERFGRWDIH